MTKNFGRIWISEDLFRLRHLFSPWSILRSRYVSLSSPWPVAATESASHLRRLSKRKPRCWSWQQTHCIFLFPGSKRMKTMKTPDSTYISWLCSCTMRQLMKILSTGSCKVSGRKLKRTFWQILKLVRFFVFWTHSIVAFSQNKREENQRKPNKAYLSGSCQKPLSLFAFSRRRTRSSALCTAKVESCALSQTRKWKNENEKKTKKENTQRLLDRLAERNLSTQGPCTVFSSFFITSSLASQIVSSQNTSRLNRFNRHFSKAKSKTSKHSKTSIPWSLFKDLIHFSTEASMRAHLLYHRMPLP